MAQRRGSKTRAQVRVVKGGRSESRADALATEEPLEIRLLAVGAGSGASRASGARAAPETGRASGMGRASGAGRTVAVTMRTPGNDFELAAGFLFSEGVVRSRDEIRAVTYCVDLEAGPPQEYNVVNVELAGAEVPDLAPLERHFFTSSACGVCGKAGLEALRLRGVARAAPGPTVGSDVLSSLPARLRAAQGLFEATGGLHAAALFDATGTLVALREDVGRHNAMDKLVGWALLEGRLPMGDHLVLVSGRASFELVQKSLTAGIPIFCAVSAASSLAVDLAREFGMTLVGFLRGDRFNVYTGFERIQTARAVSLG